MKIKSILKHFEKILNELNSLEYNNFKSIFKLKYNNVNIFSFILDKENKDVSLKIIPIESNGLRANNSFSGNKIKKKEKKNILIKSMSPDTRKINKKGNIKKTKIELFKSINIQNKIKISKEENNNNLNFNQILYNIISALIDSEIIKKKMILPLKENNTFENYYLLNSDSLYKYIENNAMKNIYNYILDNRIIDNIFSEPNITTYEKDIIIEKVISKIDPNNLEQNKINSQFNKTLKDNENLLKFSYFYKNEHDYFTFYYNFIILTFDTIKLLFNDPFSNFSKIKDRIFPILLGDNKIFIEIIKGKQFSLEIGNLDKNNVFTPILFFDYFNENILDMNKISLMKNGYELYTQYFLLFRNDYFSPIFNKESNIVGNAYIYNSAINDYSEYLINKQLEGIIELYFNDYILKEKFRDKKIINENFYILNKKYVQKIKDFYDYSNLEIELNKNKIVLETINAISLKTDDNEQNFLNKKKLALIIKSLPPEINKNFNKKQKKLKEFLNNENTIANLGGINIGSSYLFYFTDFIIINKSIYDSLLIPEDNYNECIFINNKILINVSLNNENKCVLEACSFDKNNILIPKYLLTFNSGKDFSEYICYFCNEIGAENFLEGIQFNLTNYLKLYVENEREIGIMYDLQNIYPNQKTGNNQINNISKNLTNINQKNSLNLLNSQNNALNQFNCFSMINIGNQNDKNKMDINKFFNLGSVKKSPKKNDSEIKSIDEEFIYPPLIGLQNVGATCYMNATLQCFCQIKKFVNYFKYKSYVIETINTKFKHRENECLIDSFKYLIENLWPSNKKYILPKYMKRNSNNEYFAPYKFKEKISHMNPLFEGAKANDSKDLVNFIIMTVHDELNKAPKKSPSSLNMFIVDQTNEKEILANFVKSFANENQSIVSDIFYGISKTGTQCSRCRIIKYNFQAYFFLIFPLEEIRKNKIQNQSMNPFFFQQNMFNLLNNQNYNVVNIYDCFNYNEKLEHFTGENSMYCNNCGQNLPACYQTFLYVCPEILIIVLNRGKGIEFKVKLDFQEDLNLQNYIKRPETGHKYKLIGVVTHMGESGASGHFIAYCKSPISQDWYQYNDDLVFKVNNFKQEIIDYAMPYILF